MGSIGAKQRPTITLDKTNQAVYGFINPRDNNLSAWETALSNLGRPLKKKEFSLKLERTGSRLSDGAQWSYDIRAPKGLPVFGIRTAYTQAGARKMISRFVDYYNDWYKQNGGK